MSIRRKLKQKATHWPVSGSDGFGGFVFGAPTLLDCRWEEKAELFLSDAGEEETSKAVVYFADDINAGDYLALGDYTSVPNPGTLSVGARIRAYGKISDLRNVESLRKAWL